MNKNLKIWPENIYFPKTHEEFLGELKTNFGKNHRDDDIEYVRADIAKEREKKIIEIGIRALLGVYGKFSLIAPEDIYIEAGLEEL